MPEAADAGLATLQEGRDEAAGLTSAAVDGPYSGPASAPTARSRRPSMSASPPCGSVTEPSPSATATALAVKSRRARSSGRPPCRAVKSTLCPAWATRQAPCR